MNPEKPQAVLFSSLLTKEPLLKAIEQSGYEAPTPIQEEIIPHILAGQDVIGQAQTGTGKTAAFALPLLEKIEFRERQHPQILVVAPTRELAIQVADAFTQYGKYIAKLKLLAIYGGQDYNIQLRQLKRYPQVIIGTPGRLIDLIKRGPLKLDSIKALVLDEADEMLNMGFIDDVEFLLKQLPEKKQTALFSATMPPVIQKIAKKYLTNPSEIHIKKKTATASTINQRFLIASNYARKQEALIRILAAEPTDGVLIFVRTKLQTLEIAEKLSDSGLLCSALNGDMAQNHRIRAVDQLKKGQINILVATDVAARGLDVKRVSHVINFDAPFDVESYIHRIGRTGRAGRTGEAIIFINPRERRTLTNISRNTGSTIAEMSLPTNADIEKKRISAFSESLTQYMADEPPKDHQLYKRYVESLLNDKSIDPVELMVVLTRLATKPMGGLFLPKDKPVKKQKERKVRERVQSDRKPRRNSRTEVSLPAEEGMERFRIEVGYNNNVKPANIVGAIANEADISSEFIGRISIFEDHSLVDLPYGMPKEVFQILRKARVNGIQMKLKHHDNSEPSESTSSSKPVKPKRNRKPSFPAKKRQASRKKTTKKD